MSTAKARSVCAALGALALASTALAAAAPRQDGPNEGYVELKAPLDEPRRFCFDLSGAPPDIRWADPVQAHSCKEGYEHADMLVELAAARTGKLKTSRYGRCLEARDQAIYPMACSASPMQSWKLAGDGRISPASDIRRCVTIGDRSEPANHPAEVKPPWIKRPLKLEACSPGLDARQQWALAHAKVPIR